MRIVVLGGAGDMGSRAIEDLVEAEDVEHVTVADRDVDRATALAERLAGKGTHIGVVGVDAEDHQALVEALRGHDLALSSLGPFYRFEEALVRSAIEAGVDYASICDEWEPTRAVLEHHHEAAKEAGVTVLIGLGASPGITNVAVRYLADQLDEVDRVEVALYLPPDAGGGPAVTDHLVHVVTGEVSTRRDGQQVMIPAVAESKVVEFPVFGRMRMWNMGHPEPETIPRVLPAIRSLDFRMGFGWLTWLLVFMSRWGLVRRGRATVAHRVLQWVEKRFRGSPSGGAVRVDAWGTKDGQPEQVTLCGQGKMRDTTGLCLAVGGLMLARGQARGEGGGVVTPEAALPPELFFEEMGRRGVVAYRDLALSQTLG